MEVDNPYLEPLRKAISERDKQKEKLLRIKNRKWIQNKLDELELEISVKEREIDDVKERARHIQDTADSKTALYKRSIELYREIMGFKEREGLVHKSRKLKKMLREM